MSKKRKMSGKAIFKKNGTSYSVDVKQKVIGDIKSGLLSNRAEYSDKCGSSPLLVVTKGNIPHASSIDQTQLYRTSAA